MDDVIAKQEKEQLIRQLIFAKEYHMAPYKAENNRMEAVKESTNNVMATERRTEE